MRALALPLLVGCAVEPAADAVGTSREATMKVTSTAFADADAVPVRFTCEGSDTSPPLAWSGVPAGAKSLALVVDDPDAPDPAAPKRTWVHWVVYDLPATTSGLVEGASTALPAGARDGVNDWGRPGYGGPCPPIGRHHYHFKVYALDVVLGDLGGPTKAALLQRMTGHVIAQGELIGTYQKGG